jgi:hypothetical protein
LGNSTYDVTQNNTDFEDSIDDNSTQPDEPEDTFYYYDNKVRSFNDQSEVDDWILSILNADDFANDTYLNF